MPESLCEYTLWQPVTQFLECVSEYREMQFRADLAAFQGDFPQA